MTPPVPPFPVLTTDDTVTCGHTPAGTVELASTAKLRVKNSPVLTASSIGPTVGTGCTKVKQEDVPCALVTGVTEGKSTKLRAGGQPVILSTLAGGTNGAINAVPGALTVSPAQSKLVAP